MAGATVVLVGRQDVGLALTEKAGKGSWFGRA